MLQLGINHGALTQVIFPPSCKDQYLHRNQKRIIFSDWYFSGGTAQSHGWRGCTTCPTSTTEGMKMAKRG
ncbi:hypothetical protein E2704_02970 [Salmonella enterica]|uniref:Uncharacterized protein n=2 Tax=Salmonella enterica TaxID=28901 RepID=A0A3J6UZ11_SALER|nr:hypothetical protein LFZ50_18200 [Salmonella enterica subsp. arizonae serovar 53:-:- str. SA20100345]AXC76273.1 hypothetical protein DOE56_06245 [Salmonella enterica subsp. arizonae serovar 63:g,z51:-]EAA5368757.1 hypothetical protein [Salmonella enterica subsp. arizonae]EAA7632723.1 hypothetical protein [Salmonella enterica]EAN8390558.1 hypothetical protein [Salmonella enterica subsp. arizonae serovar 13,23:gz51:-]EAN8611737.1 hypothetical protein [Salmonella enterica subsp. arizonae serov